MNDNSLVALKIHPGKGIFKMSNLTRRERERERQKKEVLQAAEKVFSKRGFLKTPMNEIAKESEFAVGTLYKFFKDKETLYNEMIEAKAEEYLDFCKRNNFFSIK